MTKVTLKKKGEEKTKRLKEHFIKAYAEQKGFISEVCKAVGISRQTFYRWKNKDKTFCEIVEDIEEGLIDFVESKLFTRIEKEDITAIIFFLKTKGKGRGYVERIEQLLQGDEFKPLKVIVTSDGNKPNNAP